MDTRVSANSGMNAKKIRFALSAFVAEVRDQTALINMVDVKDGETYLFNRIYEVETVGQLLHYASGLKDQGIPVMVLGREAITKWLLGEIRAEGAEELSNVTPNDKSKLLRIMGMNDDGTIRDRVQAVSNGAGGQSERKGASGGSVDGNIAFNLSNIAGTLTSIVNRLARVEAQLDKLVDRSEKAEAIVVPRVGGPVATAPRRTSHYVGVENKK